MFFLLCSGRATWFAFLFSRNLCRFNKAWLSLVAKNSIFPPFPSSLPSSFLYLPPPLHLSRALFLPSPSSQIQGWGKKCFLSWRQPNFSEHFFCFYVQKRFQIFLPDGASPIPHFFPPYSHSAFKVSTCPLVRDNQNNHQTSRNEGCSCPMNKQEATPHKLLFSRKGTYYAN